MANFNLKEHACREFDDVKGLVNALRRNRIAWSWGAHAWTNVSNKALRFKSEGRLFKGWVYITVNGLDLFDIYLANCGSNEIKSSIKDIYLEDLIDTIDRMIETK